MIKLSNNSKKVAKIIDLIDHNGMSVRYEKILNRKKFEFGLGYVCNLDGKNFKITCGMTKDAEPDAVKFANAFAESIFARDVDEVAIDLFRYFKQTENPVSLSEALKAAKSMHRKFVSLAGKVLKVANAA